MKNLTVIVLSCILLSSCWKFEEGPSISLIPINKRLTGHWVRTNVSEQNGSGQTLTSGTNYYALNIQKGGSWSYGYTSSGYAKNAIWMWDTKQSLFVTYENYIENYYIVKLTNSEMILDLLQKETEV